MFQWLRNLRRERFDPHLITIAEFHYEFKIDQLFPGWKDKLRKRGGSMDPLLTETNGIRRFSNAQIQEAVERALLELPPDRKLATVAHATMEGVSLSIVARPAKDWTVMAAVFQPYSGKWTGEAKVVWSPF